MLKLTVRNKMSESTMPPPAASRPNSPTRVPRPTASSPMAINSPMRTGAWAAGRRRVPIGLADIAYLSCAWIDPGLAASKKKRLASFCSAA